MLVNKNVPYYLRKPPWGIFKFEKVARGVRGRRGEEAFSRRKGGFSKVDFLALFYKKITLKNAKLHT